MTAGQGRLEAQLAFVLELDKAKQILRQTSPIGADRREDDAQHMWHLAVMVLVLAEHADPPVDVLRTLQLVLLHDVVEIDAGDVFVYDDEARAAKEEAERRAADRIYALLPPDQATAFRGAWEEFEARRTPEARFAAAVDRLQPLLLNVGNGGDAWARHGITADRVLARNAAIADGAPVLWDHARAVIARAVRDGILPDPAGAIEAS